MLLTGEELLHVLTHLIAATANRWSNAGTNICWQATELSRHSFNSGNNNAACGATPATMSNADNSLYGIVEDDRRAVGEREGQTYAALAGNESVAFADRGGGPGALII